MIRGTITRNTAPDLWEIGFGVVLVGVALVSLFIWFPHDITGGFIERNQVGNVGPGDAFFPVLLASAILVLSLIGLLAHAVKVARNIPVDREMGRVTRANLKFLARFHLIVVAGLLAIYLLGPIVVATQNVLTDGVEQYRQLVDTAPYKYIGYIAGALIMTLPIIAWAEGRWSTRALIVVLAVVLSTIVIFDVLLNNVQLPPNADY